MGEKGIYRLVILLLLGLLLGAAGVSYVGWYGMREENAELELVLQRLEQRRDSLENEKLYKEEYFSRLINDEKFASRIIREKLGLTEPDEIVFRFEDNQPLSSGNAKKMESLEGVEKSAHKLDSNERAARDGAEYLKNNLIDRLFNSMRSDVASAQKAKDAQDISGFDVGVQQPKTETTQTSLTADIETVAQPRQKKFTGLKIRFRGE